MWLKTAQLIGRTALRDLKGFLKYGRYVAYCRMTKYRGYTVPYVFQRVAAKNTNKPMFIFGDHQWTFGEAEEFTNKIANYFTKRGFKAGDDVALMMENRPELILVWLGLSKIGVSVALLNTNLRGTPLLHCTKSVNSKAIIFSPEMAPHIQDIGTNLGEQQVTPELFCLNAAKEPSNRGVTGEHILQDVLLSNSDSPTFRGKSSDPFLYVYTSGTTGLPKAALLRQSRYFLIAGASRYMAGATSQDVSYCFLPLYHFAGGVMQMSLTVTFGATAVIVPGFSAANFWKDCIKHRCTYFQYVGEVCRYLYVQPPSPDDRRHSVRMVIGNGLRPQIWQDFQNRFGIQHIREIYGATEGNGSLINLDGAPGTVGFIPTVCRMSHFMRTRVYRRYFIKVDPDTGVPLRGPDGLCIEVGPNEPGEYVAEITSSVESQFDGYTDPKATEKKLYRNVMNKGDLCFASGDVLIYDDEGYIHFKDRTGDTFRWKGENIASAEVEGIIGKFADNTDCAVFGVEVPNCEGKAGMAIISDPDRRIDLQRLLKDISTELPPYALPLFIRISDHLESTGTFKLQKVKVAKEGYNIHEITDPVYFLDTKKMSYLPLDKTLHQKIISGSVRL